MNHRTRQRRSFYLLVLFTLGVVLVIALLWLHDRRELGAETGTPVRIDIDIAGAPARTLSRTAAGWESDTGVIDTPRITPLLELLAARHRAPRYAAADVDLAGAGLDTPLAHLTLTDTNGRQTRLSIGAEDVAGERRYVREDDHVLLLAGWLWPLLQSGLQ